MSKLDAPRTLVIYGKTNSASPKTILPLCRLTICGNPTPYTGYTGFPEQGSSFQLPSISTIYCDTCNTSCETQQHQKRWIKKDFFNT